MENIKNLERRIITGLGEFILNPATGEPSYSFP